MNVTKESLLLYAVTDRYWLNGRTLASVVEEALRGGITKDNVRELAGSGICGIAVISAIFAQKDIKEAAEQLREVTAEMVNE